MPNYLDNATNTWGWRSSDEIQADSLTVVTVTTNYTVLANDRTVVANGGAVTVTLPDPTTVLVGRTWRVKNVNAAACTVNSAGTSKTLDGAASQSLAQWAKAAYLSDGTQWLTA